MQKIDDLEFIQGVNFEFVSFLKDSGTKCMLFLDDSCAEFCISDKLLDIATTGRHRKFSTIYIKHNLFHQSKLRRDGELQNTHIDVFKSPWDVHQTATLGAQLGLGSTLVDWYRGPTPVSFGLLLIDFSPRTDDCLRYCTNSGKIPSKFYVPDNLKYLKHLDDERTKSLYAPSIPTFFPRTQNSVSKNLSKRICPTWIPFRIWTTKVAEKSHARFCSLWFCAQFGKSSETPAVKGQRVFTFKDFIY